MAPNKEVLANLQTGKNDQLSTYFNNMCEKVQEYAFSNPTQLMETTEATLFGADNVPKVLHLIMAGLKQMPSGSYWHITIPAVKQNPVSWILL